MLLCAILARERPPGWGVDRRHAWAGALPRGTELARHPRTRAPSERKRGSRPSSPSSGGGSHKACRCQFSRGARHSRAGAGPVAPGVWGLWSQSSGERASAHMRFGCRARALPARGSPLEAPSSGRPSSPTFGGRPLYIVYRLYLHHGNGDSAQGCPGG